MKRLISVIIIVLLPLTLFASCVAAKKADDATDTALHEGKTSTLNQESTPDEFTLAVAVNDSLNPYTCESRQNLMLSTLIYEPLVTLDENFEPVFHLAKVISGSEKEYRIILRSGARFSDGSDVTADDVVYSFRQARKSQRYKGVFDNVETVGAVSGDVIFSLSEKDPYFANLLTFSIIPKNSKDKNSSSGRIDAPIGSGRYKYNYSADEQFLVVNEYYNGANQPNIKKIKLLDCPDNEATQYVISGDRISAWYTDFTDSLPDRIDGEIKSVNLNNLIYIGINQRSGALSNKKVRRAISFAVDRQGICDRLYYQKGVPANGLYHPSFAGAEIGDDEFYSYQINKAVEELNKIGYNNSSDDGILSDNGKALEFDLVVNTENPLRLQLAEVVSENLRLAGIKVNLKKVDFKRYNQLISTYSYDMYIGEIKLGNNMDLSLLLDKSEVTANGILSNLVFDKYRQMLAGEITEGKFKALFEKNMPVIPILYRSGLFSYSSAIGNEVNPTETDIFSGMENWTYNEVK